MKIIKKLMLALLAFTLVFTLFSCKDNSNKEECPDHLDTTGDGLCEVCGAMAETKLEPKSVELANEDGEAFFQIVLANDIDNSLKQDITKFQKKLNAIGIKTTIVNDTEDTRQDCEILIGKVTSRGRKYAIDGHKYGYEGSAVQIIDQKIIISGGSPEMLATAFTDFADNIIGIDDLAEYDPIVITEKDCYVFQQTGYDVNEIKIDGNSIKEYTIYVAEENADIMQAAKDLQSTLYLDTGNWIEIVTEKFDKSIVMREVEDAGSGGYRIYVKDGDMYIETAYLNAYVETTTVFFAGKIKNGSGEVEFKAGTVYEKDVSVVYYSDFKAKGDGKTNDFKAIKAAHEYANKSGQLVKARSEGSNKTTFYIGATGGETIPIQTNVDWTGATFIIDDTSFLSSDPDRETAIFNVLPTYSAKTYTSGTFFNVLKDGISADATNIGFAPGYKAMYVLENKYKEMYIRKGVHGGGHAQSELVVVDEKGNITDSTKLLFDYDKVTKLTECRVDDEPITLKGGTFQTLANQAPRQYTYYERNIMISRSNVVVDGLVHTVTGERTDTGAPYHGFITIKNCNNTLVQNTTLTGHRTYLEDAPVKSNMGTYDISGNTANGLYFKDCTQTNFYKPDGTTLATEYWGIMGTNYCKNITYDACLLSRLDAHAGVYNASIINGSMVDNVRLIGGGTFLLEDSTIFGNEVVSLRADYGSTWRGDIIIKNSVLRNGGTCCIADITWYYDWDFGYVTHMPTNIIVDNLRLYVPATCNVLKVSTNVSSDVDMTAEKLELNGGIEDNINPMVPTEKIIFRNTHSSMTIIENGINASTSTWLNNTVEVIIEN